jgi:hypothetical protein
MSRITIELEGEDALEALERVAAMEESLLDLKEMVLDLKDLMVKPTTRTRKPKS